MIEVAVLVDGAAKECCDVILCWMEEKFVSRSDEDADYVIELLEKGRITKKDKKAILRGFATIAQVSHVEQLRKSAQKIVFTVSSSRPTTIH